MGSFARKSVKVRRGAGRTRYRRAETHLGIVKRTICGLVLRPVARSSLSGILIYAFNAFNGTLPRLYCVCGDSSDTRHSAFSPYRPLSTFFVLLRH